jgi:hypothetical protein
MDFEEEAMSIWLSLGREGAESTPPSPSLEVEKSRTPAWRPPLTSTGSTITIVGLIVVLLLLIIVFKT